MGRGRLLLTALTLAACRGRPVADTAAGELNRLVDSLRPPVEHAVGLRFRHAPRAEVRTREQVRNYVLHKLDEEMPSSKAAGMEATYRLLGLLPDTLDLRRLMLDLYTEQIAGF